MTKAPSPADIRLIGDASLPASASLLDFWQWAFGDICDDDLKGYFAEWMVRMLLGLPLTRRVSWADSDLITPSGTRIEVKASAYWQSWKLVNEDGTPKPLPPPVNPALTRINFAGLQARTAVTPAPKDDLRRFKSDIYVFCLHTQTDPSGWDAWQLAHWEFYVLTRPELAEHGIGQSVSLSRLRKIRPAMTAAQFQNYMQRLLANERSA